MRGTSALRFSRSDSPPSSSIILPLYLIYTQIGLYDSYPGMILVHQLITLPLIILITSGFFETYRRKSRRQALDGAGIWSPLTRVVVPIAMPGIASAMIIAFIFSWNNLVFGLVLAGARHGQ